jgi:hypothetical protein
VLLDTCAGIVAQILVFLFIRMFLNRRRAAKQPVQPA